MAKELTELQTVVGALQECRARMKAQANGIGVPCVEIPIGDLHTMTSDDNSIRVVIQMDKLTYLIDHVLRVHPRTVT